MRQRLIILTFHRILTGADPLRPLDTTADVFTRLCACLKRFFRVLPLDEAVHRLEQGSLPDRAVSLTFDDGYADNATVALPILRRYALPATCFVATAFLDGVAMFNDRLIEAIRATSRERLELPELGVGPLPLGDLAQRRAAVEALLPAVKYLPPTERLAAVERIMTKLGQSDAGQGLMMTRAQLRELAAGGVDIGGHTRTHPILNALPLHAAAEDIRGGRADLQDLLQMEISSFAYPNGKPGDDFTAEHVAAVREAGFSRAVTTAWGCASRSDDHFELPRVTTWDRGAVTFLPRLLSYYFRPWAASQSSSITTTQSIPPK